MYYKENPNLGRRIVKTYNGEQEYRFNCKKIKGDYYVINKSCFEIDGTWYRINSGLIVFDYAKNQYCLVKNSNLMTGIVSFEKGVPVMGNFTPNPYTNCKVIDKHSDSGFVWCINQEILIGNNYAENFSTGIWHPLLGIPVAKLQTPANVLNHTNKGYNIEDNAEEFNQKIELLKNFNPEYTKDVKRFAKMLGDTTFGLEIECNKGYLPDNIQNQTGVVICRDGSLNDENGNPGPEFVTVPLQGAKGLQTIANLGKELPKRTTININCSLHIHFGNLPTTRMFLVSLYRLSYKLQTDIFQMFPFYKTNPEGVKKKNYNQKLPSLDIMNVPRGINKLDFNGYINDSYKALFSWLAEGCQPDATYNRKLKAHPVAHKWNRHNRYYWINFMNTIFSNRNTVEFRLHTPTTNSQKMINWLFICNAILKYANTHATRILLTKSQITLDEVLDYYKETFGERGAFLSEYLKAYVAERKEKIFNDIQKGDKLSNWDIENDKNYLFSYKGVNHLF
jgi:hypothetical protein